jgi:hypothetical protein
MISRQVGLLLLLIGSLGIGVAMGEVFHRLFLSTIPPAALSGFSRGSAHVIHIVYGACAGLVIFLWAILASALAPMFGNRKATAPSPKN